MTVVNKISYGLGDKVCLITGAAQGIGEAWTLSLIPIRRFRRK